MKLSISKNRSVRDTIRNFTTKIARPSDAMPGGDKIKTITCSIPDYSLNDAGAVSFSATLETTTDGEPDTGLYVLSNGSPSLVPRTGMFIRDVGRIETLKPNVGYSGAKMNGNGQIVFQAGMKSGVHALLLATPNYAAANHPNWCGNPGTV